MDLSQSARLRANGLQDVFKATLKFCFKASLTPAPRNTDALLAALQHHDHAITTITKKGQPVQMVATIPSWLTTGRHRHLSFLHDFFYGTKGATPPGCTHCHLCQATLAGSSLWHHLLSPCPHLCHLHTDSTPW